MPAYLLAKCKCCGKSLLATSNGKHSNRYIKCDYCRRWCPANSPHQEKPVA